MLMILCINLWVMSSFWMARQLMKMMVWPFSAKMLQKDEQIWRTNNSEKGKNGVKNTARIKMLKLH